jgi:hypothetical protein
MKLSAAYGALWCIAVLVLLARGPARFDCLGGAALARADIQRTALVLSPHTDDPALVEVTARVGGELSAAGFRVLTREPPAGVSAERAVAMAGADLSPSAVLWIVAASGHSAAAPALEIWLSDRLLGKVSMARLRGAKAEGGTPKVLAVQAVELLRARMSELRVHDADQELAAEDAAAWVERPAPPPAPAPAPRRDALPARDESKRERPWFGVSLGLAYLFGSGSLPGTPMPALGLSLGLGEPRAGAARWAFDLGLHAGAFGARERRREARGSAQLDQAYGELRAALRLVTQVPVQPFAALGLGVYTLGVRGRADPPFESHRERYWAPTGSVSAGLRTRPYAHLSLVAYAEYLQAFSRADVHVATALVARAGGAMWLLRAELMGVF